LLKHSQSEKSPFDALLRHKIELLFKRFKTVTSAFLHRQVQVICTRVFRYCRQVGQFCKPEVVLTLRASEWPRWSKQTQVLPRDI